MSSKKELRESTCTDNSGDTTQSLTNRSGGLREAESLLDIVKKEIPDVSHISETKQPLPKIAVVVDDLGPNKRPVQSLLNSDAPLVFSILPHEAHSKWIADTAYERGHEIIAHIPMEAETEKKLGAGGLYTWMKADEIQEVLEKDVETIPHIIGISNHMGSAFTADEKAMDVLMAALKKRKFVFLDSMTTQTSAGTIAARKHGVHLYKRNIFLDNKDDPAYIEQQWEKAVMIAKERGYAIVLAHPRKNTITFLEKTLRKNDVEFVTLSELSVVQ
ncbi:MAG: divergent polysaccharide deacetylase family protein [Nitrospiraceae bacterium]|nr:MAG: divergent polysaccharide deacetylase family protein [Nitrospiraceae bacterium]